MFACDYDGEMPEFWDGRDVVARKSHICDECGETINLGDSYHYETYLWEGTFDQQHTCERCIDLRDSYTALGYCCPSGNLWSDHLEMLVEKGQGDSDAAAKARAVIARRKQREG